MSIKTAFDVKVCKANQEMAIATQLVANKSKKWTVKELKACINAIPIEFDNSEIDVQISNEHSSAPLEDIKLINNNDSPYFIPKNNEDKATLIFEGYNR